MASSDGQYASSGQSRLYEAADLMLEHSRLPRIGADGGYGLPETQLPQLQPQHHPAPLVPLTPYTDYRLPYQGAPREQPHSFNTSIDGLLHSPREPKQQPGQRGIGPFPERAAPTAASSVTSHRHNDAGQVRSIYGDHKGSIEESEPISPASSKAEQPTALALAWRVRLVAVLTALPAMLERTRTRSHRLGASSRPKQERIGKDCH